VAVAALLRALAPYGLDLIGTTTPAAYDALVPATYRFAPEDARAAVIVIGNGGGAFWSAYREHVAARPAHATRAHPLDDFTAEVMETVALPAAVELGLRPSLRLPFRATTPPLSFVHLAEAAGLGRRSLLGVLVHPEYGPWMALRGALLVDAVAPAARPAAGFDPCAQCIERPCLAACPAGAVHHPSGWDVPACIDFRVAAGDDNPCRDRCHARVACVYGRRHRYPDDALAHHQERAFAVMAPR
jgi:hypothetical protein